MNPSFTTGYFYDIFHKYQDSYDLLTFNCEQSPNVKPEWIQAMKDKYGEDSNIYKVRVLGEFAPLNEDVIIRREDLHATIDRDIGDDYQRVEEVHIGVDVSSGEGNDYSVICIRRGFKELERIKVKKRLRQFKNDLISIIEYYSSEEDYVIVKIDTTGLGFQLGQDLEDYFYDYSNVEINKINFSQNAVRKREFKNVFTEMIFQFKDIVNKVSLLDIEESGLEEELSGRRYDYDFLNRYSAERKKDFVKRLGRSPDEGDAVLLAFYETKDCGTLFETYYDIDENEED